VDVVNTKKESAFTRTVFHAKGSFKVDYFSKLLTGFTSTTFDDDKLPNIDTVREALSEYLEDKLVITIGGRSDFASVGIDMADFDYFDLQSHLFQRLTNTELKLGKAIV
jgi:hypothetical protein